VQLTLKAGAYGAEYASIPGGLKVDMQNKPDADEFFSWAYSRAPINYAELKRHAGPFRRTSLPLSFALQTRKVPLGWI